MDSARRHVLISGLSFLLMGCAGPWRVDYEAGIDPNVSREWKLDHVSVSVPETLTVSDENDLAPNADIVWHGDMPGDRRTQVAMIVDEGLTRGARELPGQRPVTIAVRLLQFHSVTPAALSMAPSAVHNIRYVVQVYDARTKKPLSEPQVIRAALEANVGTSAIVAAIEGRTQRVRIVNHLASVTRGWLGLGPDQRRTFSTLGR